MENSLHLDRAILDAVDVDHSPQVTRSAEVIFEENSQAQGNRCQCRDLPKNGIEKKKWSTDNFLFCRLVTSVACETLGRQAEQAVEDMSVNSLEEPLQGFAVEHPNQRSVDETARGKM